MHAYALYCWKQKKSLHVLFHVMVCQLHLHETRHVRVYVHQCHYCDLLTRHINLVVLLLRAQVPNLPVKKALKLLRRRNCIKKQSLMFRVVSQLHCKWLEERGLLIHRSRRRIQAVLFMCTVMYTEIST